MNSRTPIQIITKNFSVLDTELIITMRSYFNQVVSKNIRWFSTTSAIRSSYNQKVARKTLSDINQLYMANKPVSMITAYDFITAKYAEKAEIDIALIGDSLAMTSLGYQDTNEVTMDEFLYHVKSVERGNKTSFLVADMPFGSFEVSSEQAIASAIKIVKEGRAQAVKIECSDDRTLDSIKRITEVGIPVMGHTGLTPQKHNSLGGFKVQGNTTESALNLIEQCKKLQSAGCFGILIECIPNRLSEIVTEMLDIPTFGIGAGQNCSGQVLVMADILGMMDPEMTHTPKFVKKYANFFDIGVEALQAYKQDLNNKTFPDNNIHGFKIKKDTLQELKSVLNAK